MRPDSKQRDRAVGALVGQAAGDALGVPYEFGSIPLMGEPQMLGGGLGGIAPGQRSDDTEMTVCIAEVAASGADLRTGQALEQIARNFARWHDDGPPDIAVQATVPWLICDTDPLATAVWHERDVGARSPTVEAVAARRRPSLYVLTLDDIPFVQDGLRDGEHLRGWMTRWLREVLAEQAAPVVEVSGPPATRMAQVQEAWRS